MLSNDMYDLFLDVEVYCTTNDFLQAREKLIAASFIAAVKLDKLSYAIHMGLTFEANLLQCVDRVAPVVIDRLRNGKFEKLEIIMTLL